MNYVIKLDNYYFHYKGKIILFDNGNEAAAFIQSFLNYSMARASQENPMLVMQVMSLQNSLQIIEKDFIEEPKCGCINVNDIKA